MLAQLSQKALVVALGASLAAPGPITAVAAPAPAIQDGEPTEAACREFGFELGHDDSDRVYRNTGAPMVGMPAPMPSPPPPPPPVMTREASVAQGTSYYAPPAVITPPPPYPGPQYDPDSERYPDADPNPVKRVADEPVSTFSIDVDTASYANVRRFVTDGEAPPRDAVRVEEMINYFDYGYDRPDSRERPFEITTALTDAPWSEGRQVVHVGLQGYELPASERRPLNLTFLVDKSGSMGGSDRIELARRSMNLIIDRLRPEDTVSIAYYASGVGTIVQGTAGDQKLKLRCAVASIHTGGGTSGGAGLAHAYELAEARFRPSKVNRVLLFTDGDFNLGVTSNERLEDFVADKRETGVYLSIYGYGRGNYQDERMQTLSQAGNGVAAYVDDLAEARRLFGQAFDRGAFPIADDVKIQVEFNPARVAEYRLIGYETRLLNEEDFTNDRIDAGEVGSGASVTALYEITPVGGPTQIPERRYDTRAQGGDPSGELAYVKVRYKLPGQDRSVEIAEAVEGRSGSPDESTRWALAVAGYGQKLRGDPWLSAGYGWGDILTLAQRARGDDPYGERAEFVQLVRAASDLPKRDRP